MEYRVGENIPGTQYRFTSVLGEGGHGTVYAVEHTFLQAPCVMKLLHADLVDHAEIAQRMTVEARTLAKLRHPNIVEVTDGGLTGESPKRPYFVMEPLNGMTLRDMRRHVQKGIGYLPALRLMIGVLEGLEHAHRNGVIHRDVKPDNIFLHRTSTDVTIPKILDFGIAHLLLGKRHTGKLFLGTPRYAAPEQLKGEAPSPATDVYAAGLVLWELITGEPPYVEVNDITALMVAHMTRPMPPLRSVMSDAPAALEQLIAYMLEKEPSKRPQTAFNAAVALRECRAIIEREQSSGIETPDFMTEQTPMDNILIGASPADAPVEAATKAPSMIEIPPTLPQMPPSFRTNGQQTEMMPNRPSLPSYPAAAVQRAARDAVDGDAPGPAAPASGHRIRDAAAAIHRSAGRDARSGFGDAVHASAQERYRAVAAAGVREQTELHDEPWHRAAFDGCSRDFAGRQAAVDPAHHGHFGRRRRDRRGHSVRDLQVHADAYDREERGSSHHRARAAARRRSGEGARARRVVDAGGAGAARPVRRDGDLAPGDEAA